MHDPQSGEMLRAPVSYLLKLALADPGGRFDERHEKVLGDLVIKVSEHFLPLFVGHYSAAPYRQDFTDFHPEHRGRRPRSTGSLSHPLGRVVKGTLHWPPID